MKKFIFTLMLAIAGCVWTMSVAETEPWIVATVHKVETLADCSIDGCPACYGVFMASVPDMEEDTSPYSPVPMAKFYQLTATDAQIAEQLNKLPLGKDVTIEGVPFTCGGSEYIQVAKIHERNEHLPSLCDEWNISGIAIPDGTPHYYFYIQRLTTDTIINGMRYVKLEQGQGCIGALREDENKNIYYIYPSSTHEYLLYAFNAKAGDKFDNVWFGGDPANYPNGSKVTVMDIQEKKGYRTFSLYVEYARMSYSGVEYEDYYNYEWIDGVGLPASPAGEWCPFDCNGDYGQGVLCAYKDGEQVYTSSIAEQNGCYYEGTQPDTIQLYKYVKDSPGSSTVDPVDPNQIVVTLQGEYLTIHEYTGDEIGYTLQKSPSSAPARRNTQAQTKFAADTFRGSASIQVSEYGTYTLELTNPLWDYTLVGTFYYGANGLEPVTPEMPAYKYLIDGRMFIRQGDRIYTPTGMQVE